MTQPGIDHFPELLERLRLCRGDGRIVRQTLEDAALKHPGDARVFLLLGAERMHAKDVDGAEAAYIAALQIAPSLHIARFQLGLLQLTSGRPAAALSTWAPLDQLDDSDPLRLFKTGLGYLVQDRFEDASRFLLEGIAHNRDNPALSKDMRMVLDRIARLSAGIPGSSDPRETRATGPAAQDQSTPESDHLLVSSYGKSN
jgi:Flp pilus assembly protein TadD